MDGTVRLLATELRSLQLICRNEFRSGSAAKPAAAKKEQRQKAQIQAALDGYDRLKASGKQPTQEAIKEEAGVGVAKAAARTTAGT